MRLRLCTAVLALCVFSRLGFTQAAAGIQNDGTGGNTQSPPTSYTSPSGYGITKADSLTTVESQCEGGDKSACQSYSDLLANECDTYPHDNLNELKTIIQCKRTATCYAEAAQFSKPPASCKNVSACTMNCGSIDQILAPAMQLMHQSVVVLWVNLSLDQLRAQFTGPRQDSMYKPGLVLGGSPHRPLYDHSSINAWDTGGNQQSRAQNLWVCYAPGVVNGHVINIPGKMIGNRCNVAYEDHVGVMDSFFLAFLYPQTGGWWGPLGADSLDNALSAPGVDENGNRLVVCLAHYETPQDFWGTVSAWLGGPNTQDQGNHLGHLVGDACHFEWGGNEASSTNNVRLFYTSINNGPHCSNEAMSNENCP